MLQIFLLMSLKKGLVEYYSEYHILTGPSHGTVYVLGVLTISNLHKDAERHVCIINSIQICNINLVYNVFPCLQENWLHSHTNGCVFLHFEKNAYNIFV